MYSTCTLYAHKQCIIQTNTVMYIEECTSCVDSVKLWLDVENHRMDEHVCMRCFECEIHVDAANKITVLT